MEFWLRSFVDHVEKAKWPEKQVPMVAKFFTKFVVKQMINTECLGDLKILMAHMGRLRGAAPQLLPPACVPLFTLASDQAYNASSIDFGDMKLEQRNEFVGSPLYKEFLEHRVLRRLADVKADKARLLPHCFMAGGKFGSGGR